MTSASEPERPRSGRVPQRGDRGEDTRSQGLQTHGAVLQVITDNDRRGGQVFAADLHVALVRRGVEVRTAALAPASSSSGLDFDVLGPRRRHPRTLKRLREAMVGSGVVVAHGSTTLPMCALAGVGLDVPFVYRQISEQLFWAHNPSRRVRQRLALSRAAHVTVLWSGATKVMSERFGVPTDRITVIPNGVPADRCPPVTPSARHEARLRFGLDPDRPTLLYLGALVPEKGADTLVSAMADLTPAGWQLLVVGRGPELPRLQRLADQLPSGAVTIHDPVSSGAEAIAAADVIGLTSRGGDSMPAVLIEAGMMGVPAVATPVEGIVDIVLDRETGRIVPLDDPAATAAAVAEVGERAREYGEAAQNHCLANFEIASVAARWHDVLDAVRSS